MFNVTQNYARHVIPMMRTALLSLMLALAVVAQRHDDAAERGDRQRSSPSPGRQVANGAGNIGVGAAKGAGDLAKGGAKTAGNLVTLHPIDAAASAGKGAVAAGKDVGVGTLKGTGKIGMGLGRAIKKLF